MHFIHPSFEHARPTLRRMVVERDLPRRTAVQPLVLNPKCEVANVPERHGYVLAAAAAAAAADGD